MEYACQNEVCISHGSKVMVTIKFKNWSSVIKLELDLYNVMTNSYTKFQVNISKDYTEKSGKLKCDGRTD